MAAPDCLPPANTKSPAFLATGIDSPELANYNRTETTDVGSFRPNAFGLYDLHGNLWEWCADSWHGNYQDAPTNGRVWEEGGSIERVFHGGSWGDPLQKLRCAERGGTRPDVAQGGYFGVRVVIEANK